MNKEKLFHIYWGVAFCAVPLYLAFASAMGSRISKDIFSVFLIVTSFVIFGLTKNVSNYIKLLLVAFIFIVFINKVDLIKIGYFYHFTMVLMFGLFCLQMISNSRKEYLPILIQSLFHAGLIQSLFAIVNYFDIHIYSEFFSLIGSGTVTVAKYTPSGATGTLGNQNILGSLIAISLPTALSKRNMYFIPVFIAGIHLSNSSAPLITAIISITILGLAFYSHKIASRCVGLGVVSLTLLTFALPFIGSNIDNTGRLEGWAKIIKHMSFSDYFTGMGAGYLRNNYKLFGILGNNKFLLQAHNEYLELVFTFGIVGALLVFLFVKKLFPVNPVLIAILTAGLVNSFFHFTFHVSITAIILLTVICFNDRSSDVTLMEL